jgi:nitrate reductase NapD
MTTNLCSCVLHTRPGYGTRVRGTVTAIPGVEVHAGAEVDKLIVTIEDTTDTQAADVFAELSGVPDVINTILIYHYGGDDLDDGFDHTRTSAPDGQG